MCQICHSMRHTWKELVYSNDLIPAVIFNPSILRGSTGILTPTLIFTRTKCSKQSNLQLSPRIKQSNVSNLSFFVTYIGGDGLFQSSKTRCHLQSLNSPRIDRDTDSHFNFHMIPVQQAGKSIKSEGQII